MRGVHHPDGVGLDGDSPFALEVHGIKNLLLHLAHCQGAGELQQAIGQRGFSVVDVRDDREVANVSGVHFSGSIFDSNRGIEEGEWSQRVGRARLKLAGIAADGYDTC